MATALDLARAAPAHGDVPVGAVVVAPDGAVWFFANDGYLRRIDPATRAVTIAGGTGREELAGDGGPLALASFSAPHGLSFAPDGTLIVSDTGNGRIRRVDPVTGTVSTLAAGLDGPFDVEAAADGSVYVAENAGNRILRVDAAGVVHVVAGTGRAASSGDSPGSR